MLLWPRVSLGLLAADGLLTGTSIFASGGDSWPSWIALPTNLFALGVVGYILMTGKYRRTAEVERELAHVEAHAEDRVRSAEELAAEKIASKTEIIDALTQQLAAMRVDRDSWREAHSSEVDARHQGERAWAASLESQSVTVRLLTALETLLASRTQTGG